MTKARSLLVVLQDRIKPRLVAPKSKEAKRRSRCLRISPSEDLPTNCVVATPGHSESKEASKSECRSRKQRKIPPYDDTRQTIQAIQKDEAKEARTARQPSLRSKAELWSWHNPKSFWPPFFFALSGTCPKQRTP